jgi:hypothetical protein
VCVVDKEIIFSSSLSSTGPEHIDKNKAKRSDFILMVSFLALRR